MRIGGDWLTRPATARVLRMLTEGGHQALFVGGCVRNAVIGQAVTDIDIATDAVPDRVLALALAAGTRAVPTGYGHGTITIVSDGVAHEVTTFRRDVETFGRHATVAFAATADEDALRRDFTMNALYCGADGVIIDPVGGLPDLMARRVRFIGTAADRIREDYLRALRFFRFQAWYGDPQFGIDAEGLAAVADLAAGLDGLSRERIGAEMRKLLSAPDPVPAVAAMAQAGVLARVLTGAVPSVLGPLIHLEQPAGLAPDPVRRLAALGGEDVVRALRLSAADAARLARLRDHQAGLVPPAVLGYRLGLRDAVDILVLTAAALGQDFDPELVELAKFGAAQRFPVRGVDLMPGFEGAALGARLRTLEDLWIASDFTLDAAALLAVPLTGPY